MRRLSRLLPVVSVTAVLGWTGVCLRAECGAPRPRCEALATAEAAFYGEVSAATVMREGSEWQSTDVVFKVRRAFKGVKGDQFSGKFRTGWSEDVPFRKGDIAVVYATERQGLWNTACSGTAIYEMTRPSQRAALEKELQQLASCSPPQTREP